MALEDPSNVGQQSSPRRPGEDGRHAGRAPGGIRDRPDSAHTQNRHAAGAFRALRRRCLAMLGSHRPRTKTMLYKVAARGREPAQPGKEGRRHSTILRPALARPARGPRRTAAGIRTDAMPVLPQRGRRCNGDDATPHFPSAQYRRSANGIRKDCRSAIVALDVKGTGARGVPGSPCRGRLCGGMRQRRRPIFATVRLGAETRFPLQAGGVPCQARTKAITPWQCRFCCW